MRGKCLSIALVFGIGALAVAAVAPVPAQAAGKFDGPWAGRITCGDADSYQNNPDQPFYGKAAFDLYLNIVIDGRRVKSGTVSGIDALGKAIGLDESRVTDAGEIFYSGTFQNFQDIEKSHEIRGMFQDGAFKIWGELAGRGCKGSLARGTIEDLKTAQAAAAASVSAQAPVKFDGPWSGRLVCGDQYSYQEIPVKPFDGMPAFEAGMTVTIDGNRVALAEISGASGEIRRVEITESRVTPGREITYSGNFSTAWGSQMTQNLPHQMQGKLTAGTLNLWGSQGYERGCKAALKRGMRPSAKTLAAAIQQPATTGDTFDGPWAGRITCGKPNSYQNNPDQPFYGNAALDRIVTIVIEGSLVKFVLLSGSEIFDQIVDLRKSQVNKAGKISYSGTFLEIRSGSDMTHEMRGIFKNGGFEIWGEYGDSRGCKGSLARGIIDVIEGTQAVAAADPGAQQRILEAQRKAEAAQKAAEAARKKVAQANARAEAAEKAAAAERRRIAQEAHRIAEANARAEAARKAADAERKKLAAQIDALRKAQEERRKQEAARAKKTEEARQLAARSATRGETSGQAGGSPLERRLATLKNLLNQGLLSQQEFDAKKQVLLNRFLGLGQEGGTASASLTPATKALSRIQKNLAKFRDIEFGQYHALVIGSDIYKYLPTLQTARNDAGAVADVLRKSYGYQVMHLQNATRDDILDALDVLREKLTDRDNLLIYYAGHGYLDEASGEGYWLPVDAKLNRRTNWVSNARITTTLKALNAKHVLVVADSCYSGTLIRGIKVKENTPDYVRRMAEKRARLAITSGGLEPVADSAGGGHSPFASVFLDVLRTNQGVMDGTEMFSQMRRPVMLKADQTPAYSDVRKAGHEGGDYLFVRRK